MHTVLIISPDPEAVRTLSLAFELDGWEAKAAATPEGVTSVGHADVVLLDMVEGLSPWKKGNIARSLMPGAKKVVILPRGMGPEDAERPLGDMDAVVTRPYELVHLVRLMKDIALIGRPVPKAPAKKPKPRRKTTQTKKNKKK